MKLKKILALLLALTLVLTAAAAATAESAETASEALTADDGTQAPAVYTLDEMLTQAMLDAYQRQAAYAAYAEAFPDNRSIAGIDMETQIVLLEMLLKANGIALPVNNAAVTVPETEADANAAIAEAEGNALKLYRSFLSQEDLAPDAEIIFHSVSRLVRGNAAVFEQKVRTAQRIERFQELMNDENAQVYVIQNDRGRGTQVIYVVNNNPANDDGATDVPQETTEPAAEDNMDN